MRGASVVLIVRGVHLGGVLIRAEAPGARPGANHHAKIVLLLLLLLLLDVLAVLLLQLLERTEGISVCRGARTRGRDGALVAPSPPPYRARGSRAS